MPIKNGVFKSPQLSPQYIEFWNLYEIVGALSFFTTIFVYTTIPTIPTSNFNLYFS